MMESRRMWNAFVFHLIGWVLDPVSRLSPQKTSNYDQLVCWWDQTIYNYIILRYNAGAALESHGFEFLGLLWDALRSALVGMEKQQAATFCMVRQQPDFYSNLWGLKTRMDRYTIHRSSQIHCFILFRYVTMICFDIISWSFCPQSGMYNYHMHHCTVACSTAGVQVCFHPGCMKQHKEFGALCQSMHYVLPKCLMQWGRALGQPAYFFSQEVKCSFPRPSLRQILSAWAVPLLLFFGFLCYQAFGSW